MRRSQGGSGRNFAHMYGCVVAQQSWVMLFCFQAFAAAAVASSAPNRIGSTRPGCPENKMQNHNNNKLLPNLLARFFQAKECPKARLL